MRTTASPFSTSCRAPKAAALVITKEKARDLFEDLSPEALAKLVAVVQKLAPRSRRQLAPTAC